MKRLSVLCAALFAAAVLAPVAHADNAVRLGAGSSVVFRDGPNAQPNRCALAAVGVDAQGRRLGLTAGHCGAVGATVSTIDGRTEVGRVVTSRTFRGDGVFAYDQPDYGFIQFTRAVTFADAAGSPARIRRIAAPVPGTVVCKYGDGYLDPGERCGVIDRVAPTEFSVLLFANFGDSGSPVYSGRSALIGILSRPSGVPFVSGVIMTRASTAVADARARGQIGGTFLPLA